MMLSDDSARLEPMVWIGPLHPHPVFEVLGMLAAVQTYRLLRARRGDVLAEPARWNVVVGAAVGAALGAKLLGLLAHPSLLPRLLEQPLAALVAGKTIVGAIVGGWIGVEIAKRLTGVRTRTGDLFAIPLCVGIGVGRVGCFLTGLADGTHGGPTSLPWGFDYGDGVTRHPCPLYEIVFVALLAGVLGLRARQASRSARALPHGAQFRLFVYAYCGWRLLIDWMKPGEFVLGLTPIQWVCAAVLVHGLAAGARGVSRWTDE